MKIYSAVFNGFEKHTTGVAFCRFCQKKLKINPISHIGQLHKRRIFRFGVEIVETCPGGKLR